MSLFTRVGSSFSLLVALQDLVDVEVAITAAIIKTLNTDENRNDPQNGTPL